MSSTLAPFCAAIPAMTYQATRVWEGNLAPTVIEHLDGSPAVTVTGFNRNYFEVNRRIGKTTAVKNRLAPMLRRRGQAVAYLDLQKLMRRRDLLGHSYYRFDHLLRKAKSMRAADVYVLDEIQHIFSFERGASFYRSRRDIYDRSISEFWKMLAGHLERGGRIVFVSAYHPLNPSFHDETLVNNTMATFFTSPVIELGTRI